LKETVDLRFSVLSDHQRWRRRRKIPRGLQIWPDRSHAQLQTIAIAAKHEGDPRLLARTPPFHPLRPAAPAERASGRAGQHLTLENCSRRRRRGEGKGAPWQWISGLGTEAV
jgi:hypothetical protein